MNFNEHYNLVGKHAFLSASKYHWLNYDAAKLRTTYFNTLKRDEGTRLHAFASEAIKLNMKMARTKRAVNQFVNDAIGFRMESEQVLYYSDFCFGTADAISFKDGMLRIHDLKTGDIPASFKQLDIYCALFCLEYDVDPTKIEMECRLYQGTEVLVNVPEPQTVKDIMKKIEEFDLLLTKFVGELG